MDINKTIKNLETMNNECKKMKFAINIFLMICL